jgi:serine/threonine protein kinase
LQFEVDMANLVGKTVGKYTLVELLGRGGMAEVYKARHPTLDRDVTVKVLHRYLADGEGFLARFEREAKAVAAMRHPHIVQIFDYEATEDANYMVMEFIDAGTLQDRMAGVAKEGKYLPVREALAILGQVAEALDYAHGRGILHRDVKPSNILLDSSGNAYLTDFGIARILSATQFTVTGMMVGTPAYMSPEQGAGEELTVASDIYSLGIIVYELFAGQVPFSSETTPLAIIHKHIHEPPPNLRAQRPDLPAAAEAVVLKSLAKKPTYRFATAGEFIRALQKALPDNAVDKLESDKEKGQVPVSTQPTMVMQEESVPGRAQMQTEVMETPSAAEEEMPQPEKITAAEGKPEIGSAVAGSDRRREDGANAPGPRIADHLKNRRVQVAAAGFAAVILLAVGGWLLFGRSGGSVCNSIEECIVQAQELRMQGDLPGYVDKMNAAIDHVPGDQHPPNAGLWCDKGEIERELGRVDGARESYTQCIEWTEGVPDLQGLRQRAEEALQGLR